VLRSTSRFVVATVLVGVLATAGCTSGRGDGVPVSSRGRSEVATPSPAPSLTPSRPVLPRQAKTIEAALGAAREGSAAAASLDFGAFWDLWTAEAQVAISRADYIRLVTECRNPRAGVPVEVATGRFAGNDIVIVDVTRGGQPATYELRFEEGRWRFQPDANSMADYRLGLPGDRQAAGRARLRVTPAGVTLASPAPRGSPRCASASRRSSARPRRGAA
jgi:hypothetical protein